ncbi:hypothetical protein OG206_01385 [Streptomyces sp. NBC_01341]|uniref:hypothetical protein n=1 Tax=Streptomyces sp. NBC_01341 TaxID=2903831 RepID=UPI002E138224|nr:hypothetical protein OG206_01385 [Streptomyces sp. NBC_01341]
MEISAGSASEAEIEQATPATTGGRREPAPTPGRPPLRAWLQPSLIALVVVAAFIACYVGLQRDPQAHHIPVAVTGPDLPGEIRQALGDAVDVHPVPDAEAARRAVQRHDVTAAISASGPHTLRLAIAGAAGKSTASAVSSLVEAYAHGAGEELRTEDVVPLARFDTRGLAGFYVAFGVSLAGFVLGSNTLGLSAVMRLRHRLWLLGGTSLAIGIVAAILVGPVLHAVPAPVAPLMATLGLLAAAAAFTTTFLGSYLGPVGLPITTLLILTVGNATSGAVIGADLLPAAARSVSALLPPGAAVRAITDLSYFNGAHIAGPAITLALWAASAALLIGLHPRLTRRRAKNDAA